MNILTVRNFIITCTFLSNVKAIVASAPSITVGFVVCIIKLS